LLAFYRKNFVFVVKPILFYCFQKALIGHNLLITLSKIHSNLLITLISLCQIQAKQTDYLTQVQRVVNMILEIELPLLGNVDIANVRK